MARVTVWSHFHKSPSQTKEVPSDLYTKHNATTSHREGCWKASFDKFLPFHHSENVPFELVETQTICWFSGRRFSPKLLFALAAMTQGEEFEQCQCITDSFPPSETHFQTDYTTLKSGLFYAFFKHFIFNNSFNGNFVKTWKHISMKDLSNVLCEWWQVPNNWWARPYSHWKPVSVCEHNLIFTLLSFSMIVLCLYRIPKGLLSAQMQVSPSCKGSKCNVPLSSGKWKASKAQTRTFCYGISSTSLEKTQLAQ